MLIYSEEDILSQYRSLMGMSRGSAIITSVFIFLSNTEFIIVVTRVSTIIAVEKVRENVFCKWSQDKHSLSSAFISITMQKSVDVDKNNDFTGPRIYKVFTHAFGTHEYIEAYLYAVTGIRACLLYTSPSPRD